MAQIIERGTPEVRILKARKSIVAGLKRGDFSNFYLSGKG
jgi:hypothetical protein